MTKKQRCVFTTVNCVCSRYRPCAATSSSQCRSESQQRPQALCFLSDPFLLAAWSDRVKELEEGEMSELEGLVSLGAGSPQAQAERGEGQSAWQGSRRLSGERES